MEQQQQQPEHVHILLNSTLDEESSDAPPLDFGGEDTDQLTSIQGISFIHILFMIRRFIMEAFLKNYISKICTRPY